MTTNEKIELLRQRLNSMIVEEDVDRNELQKVSEALDELIMKSMREKLTNQAVKEWDTVVGEVEELLNKLKLFKKMYQMLRIVDPVVKKVINVKSGKLNEEDTVCHDFWKHKKVCDNCISMKAYRQDDAILKLEIKDKDIYMVMAVPIILGKKRLVLEMIKDTTDTVFLSNDMQDDEQQLYTVMDYLNKFSSVNRS